MARLQLIQAYRGTKAALAALAGDAKLKEGEIAYTTDTKEVFIGGDGEAAPVCVGGFTAGPYSEIPENAYSGSIYHANGEGEGIFYFHNGTEWLELGGNISELDDKMNLVEGAVENNIATFDAAGQAKDSGFSISDSGQGSTVLWTSDKIANEIQENITGLDWQKDIKGIIPDGNAQYPGDGTLPAATTGDRYVLTTASGINVAWGTITGLENNDIIEFDGTNWFVAYDVSVMGDGAMAYSEAVQSTEVPVGWRQYKAGSWTNFHGFDEIIAGYGLEKVNGRTLAVKIADIMGLGLMADGSDPAKITLKVYEGEDGVTVPISVTADGVGVKVDNATLAKDNDQLKIKAKGVGVTELGNIASDGLAGGQGVALSVKAYDGADADIAPVRVSASGVGVEVDGISLTQDAGVLTVAGQGIEASHLGAIAGDGLTGGEGQVISVLANTTASGVLADAIDVSVDGLAVKIDNVSIKADGTGALYVAEVNGGTF
jgi:hypothetical protein